MSILITIYLMTSCFLSGAYFYKQHRSWMDRIDLAILICKTFAGILFFSFYTIMCGICEIFAMIVDFIDSHTMIIFLFKFHISGYFKNMSIEQLEHMESTIEIRKGTKSYDRFKKAGEMVFKRNNYKQNDTK